MLLEPAVYLNSYDLQRQQMLSAGLSTAEVEQQINRMRITNGDFSQIVGRFIGILVIRSWRLMQTPRSRAFFKEGHDDGWQNYSICFPDKKIAVVIMSNSANAESLFKELLELTIKDVYTP